MNDSVTKPLRLPPPEKQITSFWHCRNCMPGKPAGISPAEWAQIEVGWTMEGVQAWCRRCDLAIITMDMGNSFKACKEFIELHDDIFKAKKAGDTPLERYGQKVFEQKLIECLTHAKAAIDEEEER